MKNGLRLLALALVSLGLWTACSSNSGGGGGGGFVNTSVINLAVGDRGLPQVVLYFDILAFSATEAIPFPQPDVILDDAGSGISVARKLILTQAGDLIVCDIGNSSVRIFRGYESLADGAAPDVIFDAAGPITGAPVDCVLDEDLDILIVSQGGEDRGIDEVRLIYDISQVADGTNPVATSVILDNGTSLIDSPNGVATAAGDLYVANTSASGVGQPAVTIYRDISTLTIAAAPDVVLETDTSFLTEQSPRAKKLTVVGNSLYVVGQNDVTYVFSDAASLSDNALPEAVFTGIGTGFDNLIGVAATDDGFGNRSVWVGNGSCNSSTAAALSGYVAPAGSDFTDLQSPSMSLGAPAHMGGWGQEIRPVGGALIFQNEDETCNFTSVYIYRNANGIQTNQIADIIIPGLDGLSLSPLDAPHTLDAIVVN